MSGEAGGFIEQFKINETIHNVFVLSERSVKASLKSVGQLYPVLRDANGKLIDGYHRLEANPNLKSVTLENVKTEEARLLVSAHANFARREISIKEKAKLINDLAQIYVDQGLKVDHKSSEPTASGYSRNMNENQIMQKLVEVLNGAVGKSTILKYLDPRFKNQAHARAMSEKHRIRQEETLAFELIVNSFGKHISRSFGSGIFKRMKREMIAEAKEGLRQDSKFIGEIKASLRDEIQAQVEAQIGEELEILKGEWNLEKQNFFNLTNHYGDELKDLHEAGKFEAGGSLSPSERANLRRAGILLTDKGQTKNPGSGPVKYMGVSLGARLILGLVPGVSD